MEPRISVDCCLLFAVCCFIQILATLGMPPPDASASERASIKIRAIGFGDHGRIFLVFQVHDFYHLSQNLFFEVFK